MKREEQSTKITNVLADLTNAVADKFDLQELLNQTLTTTMTILEAEACSIFLKKEDNPNILICKEGIGYAENIKGATCKIGEGVTGTIASTGKYKKIDNREELNRYRLSLWKEEYRNKHWKGEKEFRNLLALPLILENETLGVIKVENKTNGNSFSDDNLITFRIIATVITLIIHKTLLQKQKEQQVQISQEQKERQTQAVREVVSDIAGELDLTKLLNKITNTVMENFHAEVISIFLKSDDKPDIIECVAAAGYAKSLLSISRLEGEPAFYEIGKGFTGTIAKTGEEFNMRNKEQFDELTERKIWKKQYNEEQFSGAGDLCRNIMALPLRRKDDIFGVIKVENKIKKYGKYFSYDDFETFKTIANIVSLVIENAKLSQKIADQLTEVTLMASHKINNQVTSYVGIKRLLQREGKTQKVIDRLDETTQNLSKIIQDLNYFAKPIALDLDTNNNINKVIRDVVEVLDKGFTDLIRVSHNLDKNIPKCRFDVARFSESITQLINNASKAIDSSNNKIGNILISTELIENWNNSPAIEVKVSDDGPGIPNKEDNKNEYIDIFKPYITTDPQGTGLGLATVKKLIEAHCGEIENVPQNEGACFKIIIPIIKS
ncbi:GAF domain-containing protein [Thiotrichales bacterium HSG1]|nr:GAF domain-containing protein [Thiotrichales bacterium HSG1]